MFRDTYLENIELSILIFYMFVNSSYTCLINDTIIKCFDSTIMGDQNKLSVIKTSDDCVVSKAEVWTIKSFQV